MKVLILQWSSKNMGEHFHSTIIKPWTKHAEDGNAIIAMGNVCSHDNISFYLTLNYLSEHCQKVIIDNSNRKTCIVNF